MKYHENRGRLKSLQQQREVPLRGLKASRSTPNGQSAKAAFVQSLPRLRSPGMGGRHA